MTSTAVAMTNTHARMADASGTNTYAAATIIARMASMNQIEFALTTCVSRIILPVPISDVSECTTDAILSTTAETGQTKMGVVIPHVGLPNSRAKTDGAFRCIKFATRMTTVEMETQLMSLDVHHLNADLVI